MIPLLLVLACAGTTPVPHAAAAPEPAYERVHRAWTRELKLYEDLETRLILRATLRAEAQRRAEVAELSWRAALPTDESTSMLQQSLDEGQGRHEVVFAAMRGAPALRSFGSDADAAWQVRLEVDGRACDLQSVERIDEPTASQQRLYPQANAWADLWVARFDAGSCGRTGAAVFTVSGAGGAGAVQWELPG